MAVAWMVPKPFPKMNLRGICFDTPLSAGLSTASLIVGCGLAIIAIIKMFSLINLLKVVKDAVNQKAKEPILPLDRFDIPAIATSSGIMRSFSDQSLSQRYMSPREPPVPGGSRPTTPRHPESFSLTLPLSASSALQPQPQSQ